jgi:DNA-binding beta-propeller fold protein YncE
MGKCATQFLGLVAVTLALAAPPAWAQGTGGDPGTGGHTGSDDGTGDDGDTGGTQSGQSLITTFFDGELQVVDLGPGQTILTAPVGTMPMAVALPPGPTPDVRSAYVPTLDPTLVEVILDTTSGTPSLEVGQTIDLGDAPVTGPSLLNPSSNGLLDPLIWPVDVTVDPSTPDGGRAYVPALGATLVVPLTAGSGSPVALLDVTPGAGNRGWSGLRGVGPAAACVGDDGDVFIANFLSGNVSLLELSGFATPTELDADHPIDIACDDENAYVVSLGSPNLIVISQTSGEVVGSIPVGPAPIGVAVDEASDSVVVSDFLTGQVTVLQSSSPGPITLLSADSLGSLPAVALTLPTSGLPSLTDVTGLSESELGERFAHHVAHRISRPGAPPAQLHRLFGRQRPGGLEQLLDELLTDFLIAQGIDADQPVSAGARGIAARDGQIHVVNPYLGTLSVVDADTPGAPPTVIPIEGGPNAVAIP